MIDEQLSDGYYRVSEVATMLDIPESTLRRWLNDFDEYLNIKKKNANLNMFMRIVLIQ